MQQLGLRLEYARLRNRIRIWYGCTVLFAVISVIATFNSSHTTRINRTHWDAIWFYTSHSICFGSWSILSTKYIFMLSSLHVRHNQINILLRWLWEIIFRRFKTKIFRIIHHFFLRNRFGNEESIRQIFLTDWNLIETKSFVKKIGKFYDALCGIMDSINFCFSFQVLKNCSYILAEFYD